MKHRQKIELAVLRLLSHQLRVATQQQLEGGVSLLCSVSPSEVAALLTHLRRRRLLGSCVVPLAVPALTDPMAIWRPSRPAPAFDAIAWAASARFATTQTRRERVYWAAPDATKIVGGVGGSLRKPLQIEHDLGVAEMFFAQLRRYPGSELRWQGEDAFCRLRRRSRGQKTPDAVLLDHKGRIKIVFDYLTQYSAIRLRDFHRYWSVRNTRYEWW